MITIESWIDSFSKALEATFGERTWFVGLQGSYARGEARETSDIDIVVILDEVSVQDIQTYNTMLDTLSNRDMVCGFFSGKCELLSWEPSELFQFYFDTKPIKGNLDELLVYLDTSAVDRAIKIGACNIYHGCVHNMLHEKSEEILKDLYKTAYFTVQAICFQQRGKYVAGQKDLHEQVSETNREILRINYELKSGNAVNFEPMSNTLFAWAQELIK